MKSSVRGICQKHQQKQVLIWGIYTDLVISKVWSEITERIFRKAQAHVTGKLSQVAQVAQARNMSIGKHRHCCITLKYKDLYGKKTYRFCNLQKWKDFNKKQLTLHKMGVTSLLCAGPWAYFNLWLFMGCSVKSFLSMYKFYQVWGLQQSSPTDPPKENSCKFAPTAPIASKFLLGNTWEFFFPFVIFLQDAFAPRVNQRLPMSSNHFIWSHQQNLGLNSALPKWLKIAQITHAWGGWQNIARIDSP